MPVHTLWAMGGKIPIDPTNCIKRVAGDRLQMTEGFNKETSYMSMMSWKRF